MATKIPGFTTTADLPADVQELYELTEPLEGGPKFDLPNYRQYDIDFSTITLHTAEVLLKRKWPYIRLKQKADAKNAPAPAPAPAIAPDPAPTAPEEESKGPAKPTNAK